MSVSGSSTEKQTSNATYVCINNNISNTAYVLQDLKHHLRTYYAVTVILYMYVFRSFVELDLVSKHMVKQGCVHVRLRKYTMSAKRVIAVTKMFGIRNIS